MRVLHQKNIYQRVIFYLYSLRFFFYQLSKITSITSFIFLSLLLFGALTLPEESLQGEHVLMLFIHVPCAFYSLGLYQLMALMSLMGLIWGFKHAFSFARATLPYCWWCSSLALLTGSLWGYRTWGTYWVWDARLTSTLILFFILTFLLSLERGRVLSSWQKNRVIAWLVIIGWIDLPIIHYSVKWWNTLHQGPSIGFNQVSTINNIYLYPLLSILFFAGIWLSGNIYISWFKKESINKETIDNEQ